MRCKMITIFGLRPSYKHILVSLSSFLSFLLHTLELKYLCNRIDKIVLQILYLGMTFRDNKFDVYMMSLFGLQTSSGWKSAS